MSVESKQIMETASSGNEQVHEGQIVTLLNRHYGDGIVYVRSEDENVVYEAAIEQGYLNREGYLTREGRLLIARYRTT